MSQHLIYAICYNFETPQLSTVQDLDRHMFKCDFLSIVNNTLLFYILYILAICFDLWMLNSSIFNPFYKGKYSKQLFHINSLQMDCLFHNFFFVQK